jgi:cytoskeletal protein RodZ
MDDEEQGQFDIVTIGERLRLAREGKELSLDDVARQTRIPIRHLQHIEAEDWDALPAPTYAIGFTRNYANAVGLDGSAIANELRDSIDGPRRRAPAPEYFEPADPARVPPRPLAIIAAVLAVLLIGGYLLWRSTLGDESVSVPVTEAPAPPPAAAPAPAAPAAIAPQAAAGQSVTLTATGEVWLRITEGPSGATLFSGSLTAGQTYQVPATAQQPMIRTGRPQMLRASVGATDIGPLAPTEVVVDDLSLKPEDIAARAQASTSPPAPAAPPGAASPTNPLALPPAN